MTLQTETKTKTKQQITEKPVINDPKPTIKVDATMNNISPYSDLGNADRFYRKHNNDIIFCSDAIWYVWTGKFWQETSEFAIKQYYYEMVREMANDADNEPSEEVAKIKAKWAKTSANNSRIKNMCDMSKTLLLRQGDALNSDTNLLNLKNGTLNLDTLEITPHDPLNYITRILDIAHDPNAKCPKWDTFLETIFPDPEVRNFVQKAVGYSMSGEINEQVLFFLYGESGTNGKTTFLETIKALLGDYADKTSIDALLETGGNGNSPRPYIADLIGKRFISTNESPSGKMWNISRIKDLTGGDSIKVRRLYKEPFIFYPTHKLWVMGNDLPPTGEAGDAFWRRVRIIPFEHKIQNIRRMSVVLKEFADEAQGILNWAIQGYALYSQEGLSAPQTVSDATTEYRTSEDIVQQFLDVECIMVDEYQSAKWVVLDRFNTFLQENGEKTQWTATRLTRALNKKRISTGGDGKKNYVGIQLKSTGVY